MAQRALSRRMSCVVSGRPATHTRFCTPPAIRRRPLVLGVPASAASLRLSGRKVALAASSTMGMNLLIVSSPDTPELDELKALPSDVKIVATGRSYGEISSWWFLAVSDAQLSEIDVLLNCGVGKNAATKDQIRELWPHLTGLKWMHSCSAGLEHLLFPELVGSPVPLTNAKGVYSHSLAEYVLTCCNFFAKDLPRLRRQQSAKNWEPYDVEELRGSTMGVVGYGDIGQAAAKLGRAFGMKVAALRRRAPPPGEPNPPDMTFSPDQLGDLMAASDYVVVATPYTPQTDKIISAEAISRMKPTGVLVNVGRGKCVDEEALIGALQGGKIRGAGLDVFATEPLPSESPLWGLDNVLMSPHCADRTVTFQRESMQFFVENAGRYLQGEELANVADKSAGY